MRDMSDMVDKKLKIKIAAAAAAVFIFAAVMLPFLIDAEQFRPQIESRLSAELGRDVSLGKLRLSLFSGRLSVEDISIMDNPEFDKSPFVTARSFFIGIRLMPLIFSKKVHITEIHLDHPSIFLRRSPEGEWNISDLGAGSAGEQEAPDDESTPDIRIGRLQITDGRVEIIEAGKKPSAYESVFITVNNLSRDDLSDFTLGIALKNGGTLNLHGKFGPLNSDDTLMTPIEADLKITHLDSADMGFIPAASGFSGRFDFSGNLNSDGVTAQSRGSAAAVNLRLVNGGIPLGKPVSFDYDLLYDLKKKTGTITDVTVGSGRAAMHISGNFDASEDVANIKMTLKGNDVPVEELKDFLPSLGITLPKGAALTDGVFDAEIVAEGPLNGLIMDGSAEITGAALTGFDLGDKIAPVANFAGLNSSVDTQIEKLYVSMRWTANGITINNSRLIIPALGEISGAGTISPRQELDLSMRMTVSHNILTALTKGKALETGFFIRGNTADPEFIPDYRDAARILIDTFLTDDDDDPEASPATRIIDSLKGLFR
jgi:AsmA protein